MSVTFKDLVNHPYTFAIGVGVANGFLAVGRGKKIDMPTALTLSVILGLGEMALVMYEPESERPMPLATIGVYSVLGVLTGVLAFVSKSSDTEHALAPAPVFASNAPTTPQALPDGATAVSGWGRSSRRHAVPRYSGNRRRRAA